MAPMTRLAIVGSRDYPHHDRVRAFVRRLKPTTTVVSGGARGVDRIAEEEARRIGLPEPIVLLAEWDRHGRSAGKIRNTKVVRACDYLVAFWDGRSDGTRDAIEKAREAGKLFHVFGSA